MKYGKRLGVLVAFMVLGTSLNAFGFLGFGNSASWKEEVLLHDGRKIVVERSQTFGGYPTLDSHERVILKEKWVFPVPGTGKKVTWETDHRNPPQGESLMLVLVGFFGDIPYIATTPAGCIAYNYWKRPNPPYVFFKYDGNEWRQISLAEFPLMLKESNVAVGRPDSNHRTGLLTVETIKEENRNLEPYLRQIIREPITKDDGPWRYPEMEYDGKGGWRSPGGAKAPHPITRPPISTDGQN